NFFVYRTVSNSEMGLYFLMNLPSGSDLYNAKGVIQTQDELGTKLRHRWQPLDSSRDLDIKPKSLYGVLPELPDVPN
ncbi:MAG TPA: hypothetical protein DEW32_07995, partial [Dehalococcoidia bacterium]|nr:hypothetical protein [Dehalococcoidia bacterium]